MIYTENWFRRFTWWQQWTLMRQHWETEWHNFVLINKQFLIRLHLHWQATMLPHLSTLANTYSWIVMLYCFVKCFVLTNQKQSKCGLFLCRWYMCLFVWVWMCLVHFTIIISDDLPAWTNITRDQVRDIKISKWWCLLESFLQACDCAKKMQIVPR